MANVSAGIPIMIHLETEVKQEGDTTKFVFDEPGQLVQVGNSLYLRYQEHPDDSEPVNVTLKINNQQDVTLTRNGDNTIRLQFIDSMRIATRLTTPYGIMDVETVTPMLNVHLTQRPVAGTVAVDYDLYAGEQLLGNYKIRLQFTT